MSILNLIASRNFIAVNKDLMRIFGIEEAIILGELASEFDYWQKQGQLDPDGFFFSTIENIENNTTIKEARQRKALNALKKAGIVEMKLKGLPAKRFIKLNEEQLLSVVQNYNLQNEVHSSAKMEELEPPKKQSNNNNIIKITNKNNISKKVSKKEKKVSFDELIENYTNNEELQTEIKNHLATRKAKKATLTNRAIELSLKKLDELVVNEPVNEQEHIKVKIVQQSIERGWIGFFQLQNNNNNKNYKKQSGGWEYIDSEIKKIQSDMPF